MKLFRVAHCAFSYQFGCNISVVAQSSCGAYSNDQTIKFKNLLNENARATNERHVRR
jgi:hypothetical protein